MNILSKFKAILEIHAIFCMNNNDIIKKNIVLGYRKFKRNELSLSKSLVVKDKNCDKYHVFSYLIKLKTPN